MIIRVLYHTGSGVKVDEFDSKVWLTRAPNDILAITYEVNGAKQTCVGWGAYFVIDDFIGGFNTITGFNGNRKKYFPCDTFLVDPRVKMGKEITDEEWSDVSKLI